MPSDMSRKQLLQESSPEVIKGCSLITVTVKKVCCKALLRGVFMPIELFEDNAAVECQTKFYDIQLQTNLRRDRLAASDCKV